MSGPAAGHTDTADHSHDPGHSHDGHAHDSGHPSTALYVKVAAILAAITGVEVFSYFKSVLDWGRWLMPLLLIMMVVKFYLIAMYFMHLKFDPKIARRALLIGIGLALMVYLIMLMAFKLFSDAVPH